MTTPTKKTTEITFSFPQFINMQKISLFRLFTLDIQTTLESCDQRSHSFFDHARLKNFQSKNFKIQQSDWLKVFLFIYQEQDFSQI